MNPWRNSWQKSYFKTFTTTTTTNTRNSNRHPHLPLSPPRRGDPGALHVSRAVIAASSATSPAPPVLTTLLCLVSTVLASLHLRTLTTTTTFIFIIIIMTFTFHNLFILTTMVAKIQHVLLRRVQFLASPEAPKMWTVRINLSCCRCMWSTWGGSEKRENAKANTKGGGWRQGKVRGNGLVLLVHGRSWSNEEDVSETQHGFIGFDWLAWNMLLFWANYCSACSLCILSFVERERQRERGRERRCLVICTEWILKISASANRLWTPT